LFLSSSGPGPYDVRFQLLGVPVRIAPFFWIAALVLGGDRKPELAAMWVAVVLVSVLVHEFGHALTQRFFGGRPEIVLYAFGGYASAYGCLPGWWRNVLIALAGPFAGFVLAGLVYAYLSAFGTPPTMMGRVLVSDLLFANVAWGVLNLAPIWPLDGGHVAREVLTQVLRPSTGIAVSLVVSGLCAAALAAWSWVATGSMWNTALAASLAYQSFETLQQYRASRGY
jgi:membrane-associated protease RseP (regulator of RpoE activity)